jgi:hypothetical protein
VAADTKHPADVASEASGNDTEAAADLPIGTKPRDEGGAGGSWSVGPAPTPSILALVALAAGLPLVTRRRRAR